MRLTKRVAAMPALMVLFLLQVALVVAFIIGSILANGSDKVSDSLDSVTKRILSWSR